MVAGLQTGTPFVELDEVQVFESLAAAATFVIANHPE